MTGNESPRRLSSGPRKTTYFLLLGVGLALSCADVSTPLEEEPEDSVATGGAAATGGDMGSSTGGGVVIVNGAGGTPMTMGGASTGGIVLVGDGDGDGDGDAGMGSCQNDSDCDSMPGCNVCSLNSTTFLFECMPDPAATDCSGECVDLQTDANHCGMCGDACAGDLVCTTGSCACSGGQDQCGDTCTDLQTDTNNCGTCGEVCSGDTPFCVSGGCSECAVAGQTDCSGTCTDLQTDVNNCGTCGMTCNAANSQVCVDGMCEDPGSCAAPDVTVLGDASCGSTFVFENALYECISSNLGGCDQGSNVFCQVISPDTAHWGPMAWKKLLDCP